MAKYVKGFQGNPKIRNAGVGVTWDEHNIQEFLRCSQDLTYFIENYVYIKSLDSEELILFKPRVYQHEMIEKMMTSRFVITKLPRQAGKTVIVAATLLWHLVFNRNYSILSAAHNLAKARDIVSSVKQMYENLPDWLQHGVMEWNKTTIILENGSRMRAAATSGSSARGDTYNLVYIDEAAFIPTHVAEDFFKSVIPTVMSGQSSKIFVTSTPKGLNHFYMMWQAAKKKLTDPEKWSGYEFVEIKWNDVPGRDEAFKKRIIATYGQEYFDQEYAAEFLGSSKTLISGNKLLHLQIDKPIIATPNVHIYEHAQKNRSYAITVDVAEGLGGDASAMVVFDITQLPYTVVAVYKNSLVQPMTYPGIIHQMAHQYNDAIVLVEANFGQQIADILFTDLEYDGVVMTARNAKKGDHMSGGFAANARPGLVMNKLTKRLGCSNLKTLVEQDQLLIRDDWIYQELCRFSVKGGSYAAEEGHDDLAMCLVMFAWMVDQGYVKENTDIDIRKKIAEMNAQAIEDDMMPLGFRTDGFEEEHEMIMMDKNVDRWHDVDRWNAMFDKQHARKGMEEIDLRDLFAKDFGQWDKDDKPRD